MSEIVYIDPEIEKQVDEIMVRKRYQKDGEGPGVQVKVEAV